MNVSYLPSESALASFSFGTLAGVGSGTNNKILKIIYVGTFLNFCDILMNYKIITSDFIFVLSIDINKCPHYHWQINMAFRVMAQCIFQGHILTLW